MFQLDSLFSLQSSWELQPSLACVRGLHIEICGPLSVETGRNRAFLYCAKRCESLNLFFKSLGRISYWCSLLKCAWNPLSEFLKRGRQPFSKVPLLPPSSWVIPFWHELYISLSFSHISMVSSTESRYAAIDRVVFHGHASLRGGKLCVFFATCRSYNDICASMFGLYAFVHEIARVIMIGSGPMTVK